MAQRMTDPTPAQRSPWMRRLVVAVIVVGLLVVGAMALLPRWLSDNEEVRAKVEAILSDALQRSVTIERLVVDEWSHVVLWGVTVAQPDELDAPQRDPMLRVERVELSVELEHLLKRDVIGRLDAHDVTMVVLERGGRTSVHGLGRPPDPSRRSTDPPDLALDIALHSGTLQWVDLDRDESLDVRGLTLEGHLSNRAQSERQAAVELSAGVVAFHDIEVHQVAAVVELHDRAVELQSLSAEVADGRLEGSARLGRIDHKGATPTDWSVALTLRDSTLAELRTWVRAPAPLPSATDPALEGTLDATVELTGEGLRWSTVEPSVRGTVSIALRHMKVPDQSVVLRLAELAGREPGPWSIEEVSISVRVDEGWVHPRSLALGELRPSVGGRVSLSGQLDLTVDLMPLVEVFGGGVYAKLARTTASLPVRIEGTLRDPSLAAPSARDVAKGLLGWRSPPRPDALELRAPELTSWEPYPASGWARRLVGSCSRASPHTSTTAAAR